MHVIDSKVVIIYALIWPSASVVAGELALSDGVKAHRIRSADGGKDVKLG